MTNFKWDKIILDTNNSLGDVRKRCNLNTVLAVIAIVLSIVAIVVNYV